MLEPTALGGARFLGRTGCSTAESFTNLNEQAYGHTRHSVNHQIRRLCIQIAGEACIASASHLRTRGLSPLLADVLTCVLTFVATAIDPSVPNQEY